MDDKMTGTAHLKQKAATTMSCNDFLFGWYACLEIDVLGDVDIRWNKRASNVEE